MTIQSAKTQQTTKFITTNIVANYMQCEGSKNKHGDANGDLFAPTVVPESLVVGFDVM